MSVDITVKTVTPDPVPPPPQFQITLSLDAARALYYLAGRTTIDDLWKRSKEMNARYQTSKEDVDTFIKTVFNRLGRALPKD